MSFHDEIEFYPFDLTSNTTDMYFALKTSSFGFTGRFVSSDKAVFDNNVPHFNNIISRNFVIIYERTRIELLIVSQILNVIQQWHVLLLTKFNFLRKTRVHCALILWFFGHIIFGSYRYANENDLKNDALQFDKSTVIFFNYHILNVPRMRLFVNFKVSNVDSRWNSTFFTCFNFGICIIFETQHIYLTRILHSKSIVSVVIAVSNPPWLRTDYTRWCSKRKQLYFIKLLSPLGENPNSCVIYSCINREFYYIFRIFKY